MKLPNGTVLPTVPGDTHFGLHASAFWGDTRYMPGTDGKAPQLDADIAQMKAMHMSRIKFLVRGDSQLHAVRAFAQAGFIVSIRYYSHFDEGFGALPVNELQAYQKAGAVYCEGRINEFDNESAGKPPTPDNIKTVAEYWRSHADTCAHAGLIPLSPAFEGDRLERWVLPMVQYMLDHGYEDRIKGSVIAGHFRTGAYYGPDRGPGIPESKTFPPEYDPIEPGDQTGFCFRSYERWDAKLYKMLGYHLVYHSTETGIEPAECRGELALHAEINRRMAQMVWIPNLECCHFWIGIPGGMGNRSAWIANTIYANPLPIIKVFTDMPAPVHGEQPVTPPTPPEPPTPPAPPEIVPAIVGDSLCKEIDHQMATFPWTKKMAIYRGYQLFGDQVSALDINGVRYYGHPAQRKDGSLCIVACRDGHYTPEETVEFEYKLP